MDQELIAALCRPISAEAPAGEDCRYEDDYLEVQQEKEKLSRVGRGEPDWARVVALCAELLSQRTKDLNLFGALCLGLFGQGRYAGLASGLELYGRALRDFWPTIYPPLRRSRARKSTHHWLAAHLTTLVRERPPHVGELEAAERCADAWHQVQQLAAAHGLPAEKSETLAVTLASYSWQLRQRMAGRRPPPGDAPLFADVAQARELCRQAQQTLVQAVEFIAAEEERQRERAEAAEAKLRNEG